MAGPQLRNFRLPTDITLDRAGNIYFADGVISTVAGGGTAQLATGIPATSAALSPSGLAVDGAGNLYIASGFIMQVGPDGIINVLAQRRGTSGGRGGFICSQSGDRGPASAAVVCYPNRLAVDSTGNLYLTDGGRVRKITADGIIRTVAAGEPCTLEVLSSSSSQNSSYHVTSRRRALLHWAYSFPDHVRRLFFQVIPGPSARVRHQVRCDVNRFHVRFRIIDEW